MKLLRLFGPIVLAGAQAGVEVCRQLLSHNWRLLDWIHGLLSVKDAPRETPCLLLQGLLELLNASSARVEAAKEVRCSLLLLGHVLVLAQHAASSVLTRIAELRQNWCALRSLLPTTECTGVGPCHQPGSFSHALCTGASSTQYTAGDGADPRQVCFLTSHHMHASPPLSAASLRKRTDLCCPSAQSL